MYRETFEEYKKRIKPSTYDMELQNIISDDMSTIWQEVGGQDGMYENFPIIRFYRGDNNTPYRVYALDSGGGVAIISYINKSYYYKRHKIVTLGEDDGFHFLNGSNLYCDYFGEKKDFLFLLSEAISMLNNNI